MRKTTLILVAVLALGGAPTVPARTWTSASGSTIEAELAGRDGEFVMLKGADGRQFKIQIRKLSEADQAYLDRPAAAEPSLPAPAAAPEPVFASVSFQPPPPLTTDRIPGVELLAPGAAGSIGLQFGPGPDDVLYLIVDPPSLTELPQGLYLYSPGHPPYQTPTRIAGKRSRYDEQRVVRFNQIALTAEFAALQADYEIELICGIERPDVTAVLIDVRLREDDRQGRFSLGGYFNEAMLRGPGQIPVLPILARPVVRAAVNARPQQPTVTPSVAMGPFTVRPPNRKIMLVVTEGSGKTAEKQTAEVTEDDLLSFGNGGTRITFEELEAATAYTLQATANLGEIVGTVNAATPFTTRADTR